MMETITVTIGGIEHTLQLIDAKDVPHERRKSFWRDKFNTIPKGYAWKVEAKDRTQNTRVGVLVANNLRGFQRLNQFKNFEARRINGITYIINH